MFFYISVFILLLMLATTEVMIKNKKISVIIAIIMSVLAGLRFNTGYDFKPYSNFYSEIDNISDIFNGSIDAEPGFLFLNFLFKTIGFNFYFFILFFSLLSILLLWYFVYKFTDFPSLVLVYYFARYFLVRDMGQIRSALACIILLYSIPYIIKQEPVKFLTIIFIASLFHVTAWFFIIAYIFNILFKDITIKSVITLLFVSFFIGLLVQFPDLYIWIVPDRYIPYFTNPSYTNGQWIFNPVLWMQLLLFLATIVFVRPTNLENKNKLIVILKIYLIASLILIAAGFLGTVGGRISTLYATSEILVVPVLFNNVSKNKAINFLFFCNFTIAVFCLIFIISGAYTDYIPYQTIFGL